MDKNKVYFAQNDNAEYPNIDKSYCFSPSEAYPEYSFDEISGAPNLVYKLVRDLFVQAEYDKIHIGTPEWNPLSVIINKGDTVLLKPNWVLHINNEPIFHDMNCLVTHPSIVRCVLDYVVKALDGTGKIIVADAPIQKCHFDVLQETMGYNKLWKYYEEKGIHIHVVDLRNTVADFTNGKINVLETNDKGMIVKVDKQSAFVGLDDYKIEHMRITNYPTDSLSQHHTQDKHEYMVSRDVLNADVIINMPKPKSHRKAGLTACSKNFVGINSNKEFLPHHIQGDFMSGKGDEYLKRNPILAVFSKLKDFYNNYGYKHSGSHLLPLVNAICSILNRFGHWTYKEKYSEGSWWGNDTIWRTLVDLNLILLYGDKSGNIQSEKQRKLLNICDCIIAGEKEGPMIPSPKHIGAVMMGGDVASTDLFICKMYGFHPDRIKYIDFLLKRHHIKSEEVVIYYESEQYKMDSFVFKKEWNIQPTNGWKGHI